MYTFTDLSFSKTNSIDPLFPKFWAAFMYFDNGYGVSVVRLNIDPDLYRVCTISDKGAKVIDSPFALNCTTETVTKIMQEIQNLPNRL